MDYKGDIYYIELVLNGRISAFTMLVDRYKERAFNLAFKICGNREDAEEVAQDSFLKAFRSLQGFKKKSSFATWFYRIVYNTSVSSIRSRKKGILSLEDFPVELKDFSDHTMSEEMAEVEYRNSLINFALQKIHEEERALICLYYYEEMNVEELSAVTGISKSNIKVKLFRARQKMIDIIEKIEKKKLIYHEQI